MVVLPLLVACCTAAITSVCVSVANLKRSEMALTGLVVVPLLKASAAWAVRSLISPSTWLVAAIALLAWVCCAGVSGLLATACCSTLCRVPDWLKSTALPPARACVNALSMASCACCAVRPAPCSNALPVARVLAT